eukprot:2686700-Prymnesium_polylepis.1
MWNGRQRCGQHTGSPGMTCSSSCPTASGCCLGCCRWHSTRGTTSGASGHPRCRLGCTSGITPWQTRLPWSSRHGRAHKRSARAQPQHFLHSCGGERVSKYFGRRRGRVAVDAHMPRPDARSRDGVIDMALGRPRGVVRRQRSQVRAAEPGRRATAVLCGGWGVSTWH